MERVIDTIAGEEFIRTEPGACPLCGASRPGRRIDVAFGQVAWVAECRRCRLAYQNPLPSPAAGVAYMNMRWGSADAYVADRQKQVRRAEAQLALVHQEMAAPGRLLDFGAGVGTFVHAASAAGWTAVGVERSGVAVTRAEREFAVRLLGDIPAESYDVLTLWDVIEHLREPARELADMADRVKSGGRIFVETGNWESWDRLVTGDRWGLFLFDHHSYFSPASLEALLARCGFDDFRLLGPPQPPPPFARVRMALGWRQALEVLWRSRTVWRRHAGYPVMTATARRR